jgi:1,2-diacylglycerol 3-alpha-glucosyltransferase
MSARLVILTEIISPYRIPLFNTLAHSGQVDLHVIFLAETDPALRHWKVYKDEIHFSYEVLPSRRINFGQYQALLNRGVSRALAESGPDVILCGGYNYLASWQALRWARAQGVPFLLWSESTRLDRRRSLLPVEFLKRKFMAGCSGFVVPGESAWEYLSAHGIEPDRISKAPNAVDNALFASASARARTEEDRVRHDLNLPEKYFLYVGRFVPDKGVLDLLSAYAKLEDSIRRRVGLVLVGDGVARGKLELQAASISPGKIVFPGFTQREQLGAYYALAEALMLPTYTDTWGLVVNEGMACGLPVILSGAAGCAADLVQDGGNGFLCSPGDVGALARAMTRIASDPELCRAMGAASIERIRAYSPEEWCKGILGVLDRKFWTKRSR